MENIRLINLIFQSKYFHFVLAAHNEVLGSWSFGFSQDGLKAQKRLALSLHMEAAQLRFAAKMQT